MVFVAIALALSASGFVLGPYSYLKWHDLGDSHVARYEVLARTFGATGISYWYPYAAGGVDLLSNGARYMDWFFVLWALLPGWAAAACLRFTQVFIAGYFMRLILVRHLGLSASAALLGGVLFAAGQLNLMEHYFGIGALPAVLWGLASAGTLAVWLGLGAAAAIGVAYSLASFAHLTFIFALPAMIVWLSLQAPWNVRRLSVFAAFIAAYMLAQVDLLAAMYLNLPSSHRLNWDLASYPWEPGPTQALAILLGVLPASALALGGLIVTRQSRRVGWVMLGGVAGTLLLVAMQAEIRTEAGRWLVALKGFNLSRFAEFIPFFLAVGAAWGWTVMAQVELSRGAKRLMVLASAVTVGFAAYAAVSSTAAAARDWVLWGSYQANFRNPDLEKIAAEARAAETPFRVATVQSKGLNASYASSYGLETADGYLNMYSNHFQKIWGMVIAPELAADETLDGYYWNYGPRLSLYVPEPPPKVIQAATAFRFDLLSLMGTRYVISLVPVEHPDLDLLNRPDAYWDDLSRFEKLRRRVEENFSGRHLLIYRNRAAMPRWFFATKAEYFPDEPALAERLRTAAIETLGDTVLLLEKDRRGAMDAQTQTETGNAIAPLLYTPDHIVLETRSSSDAILVLTNGFSPFWRATVDGRPTEIMRANLAFWAVSIPAGRHRVAFAYDPPYRAFPVKTGTR